MRAESIHNPSLARRPKIDLDGTSGENPPDGLVKLVQKLANSVIGTSSKVHKPKIYNEVVNNPINGNRWQKAINEKL